MDIRTLFYTYGKISLAAGGALLAILLLLRLFSFWLDWETPLVAADLLVFAGGFIVVALVLGPYVVTVGQLAKVARLPNVQVQKPPALSPERRRIWWGVGGTVVAGFVIALIISRSVVIWLCIGSLFVILGAALLYIGWRVARIERAAKMKIYAQDYSWWFKPDSFFGILDTGINQTIRR
jgi:hypothetical protein